MLWGCSAEKSLQYHHSGWWCCNPSTYIFNSAGIKWCSVISTGEWVEISPSLFKFPILSLSRHTSSEMPAVTVHTKLCSWAVLDTSCTNSNSAAYNEISISINMVRSFLCEHYLVLDWCVVSMSQTSFIISSTEGTVWWWEDEVEFIKPVSEAAACYF